MGTFVGGTTTRYSSVKIYRTYLADFIDYIQQRRKDNWRIQMKTPKDTDNPLIIKIEIYGHSNQVDIVKKQVKDFGWDKESYIPPDEPSGIDMKKIALFGGLGVVGIASVMMAKGIKGKKQVSQGDVWSFETKAEEEAIDYLNMICDNAIKGNKNDQMYLEKVFDEKWKSIKPKLETEGSTYYVWWMDGVHRFLGTSK